MIQSVQLQYTKTETGKSNRWSGVQRAASWCESSTCAGGEWAPELRPQHQPL